MKECNIIMLNTSITAGNDDDRGYLFIGSSYLQMALDKIDKNKPTIMIGHHGNSFLNREESKYIQHKLKESNVSIYLCGHEHSLSDESVWDNVRQYTSGCIWNDETPVRTSAGYYIGSLEDNVIKIDAFSWDNDKSIWWPSPVNCNTITLSSKTQVQDLDINKVIKKINSSISQKDLIVPKFTLNGHALLGGLGKDGIKYYWLKDGNRVESLAFNTRTCYPHHDSEQREIDSKISSYTTSVSYGCVLSASNQQCRFCETGSKEFKGFLTSDEIALQNIFMALYDANCPSFSEVRNHKREFAFMGQGEPGFSYSAIRRAIMLTDIAMEEIKQTVYRYIISTCGVFDFMPILIKDLESHVFKNEISLHFSLHSIGDTRKVIMPVENQYPYKKFLELCKKYYNLTNKKIGVGIMMFKDFIPVLQGENENVEKITLDEEKLQNILQELDKDIFKIDLCDFNPAPSVTAYRGEFKNENAIKLRKLSLEQGFDTKTFSSFGSEKNAGCGMLKSIYNDASEDLQIKVKG